ncbi:MAG: DNA polymerase Y family protein [Chitinophagaceae bacterium]|nr:DNA polymerase Y family protein [Chitinophagaceae bacterium]
MCKRYVSIWFRYLLTDWVAIRRPALRELPFVLAAPDHGRMVINAANRLAELQGVFPGMAAADARAIIPSLEVLDDKPGLAPKLLIRLAEWFTRYTPAVAIDLPDGLILDASGCAHLWGGEREYLRDIIVRMKSKGYYVRAAMTDTVGSAWAIARFGKIAAIIGPGEQCTALLTLPPAALRIEEDTIERLQKLGLRHINNFIGMPRNALRRRFGATFLKRLDQALGHEDEAINPVYPVVPYHERLPCIELIVTRGGIEIALMRLLETLTNRLRKEGKGMRTAIFKGFRIDGKIESLQIGTNRPSNNVQHLFRLFEINLEKMEPALGIELFLLEAPKVEDVKVIQEKLWEQTRGLDDTNLSGLLDRFAGKFGEDHIHRYLPDEHYWPERSMRHARSLTEKSSSPWKLDRPRPLQLLARPERIDVTAPIPDYPPMLFRYKGILHKIVRADGPERIEQEWWLQQGEHRDYYSVEDEQGQRYWLFRLGHYIGDKTHQWYLHGFFP